MGEKQRVIWADLLRVGAIYAVILLHSAAPLLIQFNSVEPKIWWIGNLYDSAVRWCVPVFIMLSGALVLGHIPEKLSHFFLKRMRRVLIPFLVWSIFYAYWSSYYWEESFQAGQIAAQIFIEPLYYHLWFLYIIIGLYLLAPLLSIFLVNAAPRIIWYALAIWFIFFSILPVAEYWLETETYFSTGRDNSTLKFIGYFILGYFLKDIPVNGKKFLMYFLLFMLGLFITAYGTYLITKTNNGDFNELFYEYYSPNVLLMSVSVFMMGKGLLPEAKSKEDMNGIYKVLRLLSTSVLGVYLVHAFIIDVLKGGILGFEMTQETYYPLYGIPLFATVVFVISYLIVAILQLIPVIKETVS